MKTGLSHLQDRFLYDEFKRRIDPQAVLDYYGAQNSFTVERDDGTVEVQHSCLLDHVEPHHTNGDQNPSARMNLDKKVYICYSYWGGDIFHLILKMEQKKELSDVVPLIREHFLNDDSGSTGEDFLGELEALFSSSRDDGAYSFDLPAYNSAVLRGWEKVWSFPQSGYLTERGLTESAVQLLGIGFDPNDQRFVFPHWVGGTLVGWQKRAVPARVGRFSGTPPDHTGRVPKYKNTTGFPKHETLYGLDLVRQGGYKSVVLVESPFSVAKAYSLGCSRVVASFGAFVSNQQLHQLKEFEKVYVWMDDDDAGRKAEPRIVEYLHKFTEVLVVEPDKGKDLGDCETGEEVARKLMEAVPAFLKLAEYDARRLYGG